MLSDKVAHFQHHRGRGIRRAGGLQLFVPTAFGFRLDERWGKHRYSLTALVRQSRATHKFFG